MSGIQKLRLVLGITIFFCVVFLLIIDTMGVQVSGFTLLAFLALIIVFFMIEQSRTTHAACVEYKCTNLFMWILGTPRKLAGFFPGLVFLKLPSR